MNPILDIRSVRPGLFTYSLRAPGQPERPCGECFESLEHCMNDAACALLKYFDRLQLHVCGLPIGTYAPRRLLQEPGRIAKELEERFARVHGAGIADTGAVPLSPARPVKPSRPHLYS